MKDKILIKKVIINFPVQCSLFKTKQGEIEIRFSAEQKGYTLTLHEDVEKLRLGIEEVYFKPKRKQKIKKKKKPKKRKK